MIERAGVFDAQRMCHDAKMARWDHVEMLDLTPCVTLDADRQAQSNDTEPGKGQPSLAVHPLAPRTAFNNRSNLIVKIERQSRFIELDAISISIENFRNPLFDFLNMF